MSRPSPGGEGVLRALAPDLWVAERSLKLVVGDIGARMTVIRLRDGGLVLHSPVRLDAGIRRAARASVDRILRWDFDRVIVAHGDVLERGGRDRFAAAFAFL